MADAPAKTSAKGWLVFFIIFAYSVTACMGWFNMTGTGVKYVLSAGLFANQDGLHTIGVAMSAVSITALIMAFPAGWMIRKWGGRTVMLISMIFSIVGVAIVAAGCFSMNFATFIAGRVISGIGVGTCGVACTTLVSLWIADSQKGLALAIWGIWVPVGMIIVYYAAIPIIGGYAGVPSADFTVVQFAGQILNDTDMGIPASSIAALPALTKGIGIVWICVVVLMVIELVLTFIIVRDPDKSEATEVSAEREPYSSPRVKAAIKQPQLWMLCIAWLAFNFCNMAFTNNMSTWLNVGGFSFSSNAATVTLINTILSACGIIAPFFGIIYDKIQKNKKWMFVAFGLLSIAIMCITGFKAWGDWNFWVYAIFQVLGNCICIASIRPYVPMLTGRGGATAVAFGFSLITLLQQLGNTLSGIAFVTDSADLMGSMTQASWMTIVPVAIIGFICTLFIRLPKAPAGAQGGKPEGK